MHTGRFSLIRSKIFAQALILAAATLIAIPADAADMTPRPVYKASPPQLSAYNWTGLYVGAHAGHAWGESDFFFPDFGTTRLSPDVKGYVGGGQVGYLYQIDSLVLGVEASLSTTGIKGSGSVAGAVSCATGVATCRVTDVELLTVVGPRVGFAAGQWLLSVNGGYAAARISTDAVVVATGLSVIPDRQWHRGWAIGGGVDYAFSPTLSLGLEFQHVELDDKRHAQSFGAGNRHDVDLSLNVIRARLNFKLFDPAPAVRVRG